MKNLKNLGKVLSNSEQKMISGGGLSANSCNTNCDCYYTHGSLYVCYKPTPFPGYCVPGIPWEPCA